MTRERAIEVLKAWDSNWSDNFTANEFEQAFNMAINSLEVDEQYQLVYEEMESCKSKSMANIKDDVTLNGKIVDIVDEYFRVDLKDGQTVWTRKENFNTVRPYIPKPEKDERKGN